jgi:FHA domain-containing protein
MSGAVYLMIRITVLSRLGKPVSGPTAEFGPQGGSIGRSATNTLVLDDPERVVSRVQAQIVCREGHYYLLDRGSNPVECNGRSLGNGCEAAIADGDRLLMGDFELAVQAAGAPPVTAPPKPAAQALTNPHALALSSALASPPGPGSNPVFPDIAVTGGQSTQSIDKLFGDGDGLGGDPLALSSLADPLHQPNTAAAADPLAALAGGAPVTPAPRSDHLPIDRFGFNPPLAVTPASDPVTAPPAVDAQSAPFLMPQAAPAAAAPSVPSSGSGDPLLEAFLRGLGGLDSAPPRLTPELMERIGVTLRAATEGTLQLLLARQEFKREVRAEVTMISTEANNPLKFSPIPEVALAHLLGPGVRGFMSPREAMRDAFNDLRAHQFGIMVGLRSALMQLFARLAPQLLEQAVAPGRLDGLFTARRKARLWNRFTALYTELAHEAEDDFDGLFAKAFTEAYEVQMAKFKANS